MPVIFTCEQMDGLHEPLLQYRGEFEISQINILSEFFHHKTCNNFRLLDTGLGR